MNIKIKICKKKYFFVGRGFIGAVSPPALLVLVYKKEKKNWYLLKKNSYLSNKKKFGGIFFVGLGLSHFPRR